MKIKVSNRELNIFLFLLPVSHSVMFWLNVFGKSNIQIGSYFNFLILVLLYKFLYEIKKSLFLLNIVIYVALAIFYQVFLDIKINESFSYLTSLNIVIISLYVFPKFDFSGISINKFKDHLTKFSILFVLVYEISSHFARDRNVTIEYYDVERVYKEGFVISHLACYYLVITGLVLFQLRSKLLAFFLWGYVASLGPRIGLVYIAVTLLFLLVYRRKQIINLITTYKYFFLLIIIITGWAFTKKMIATKGADSLMVYSSGRSVVWISAISKIIDDGLGIANIVGRGPKSSIKFNEKVLDIPIWMHNDFLDIIFNLGAIGLIIYFISFFKFFSKVPSQHFFYTFFLSAFLNGFFLYDPIFIIALTTLSCHITSAITNKKLVSSLYKSSIVTQGVNY